MFNMKAILGLFFYALKLNLKNVIVYASWSSMLISPGFERDFKEKQD
jgi:hypothetical protein